MDELQLHDLQNIEAVCGDQYGKQQGIAFAGTCGGCAGESKAS